MDYVIGIGNTLRCDDGIGARLTAALPEVPNVAVIAVHQLTPEIALKLCDADRVLFVDAHSSARRITLARVVPDGDLAITGHVLSPPGLLGLTRVLCEHVPQGWLLSVPGYEFGFGEKLSPQARFHLPTAIAIAERWMKGAAVMEGGMDEQSY